MTTRHDIGSDGDDQITIMDLPDIALDWVNFWVELNVVAFRIAFYPLLLLTGLEAPPGRPTGASGEWPMERDHRRRGCI